MSAPDTSAEAVEAMAQTLTARPLYEGHGEESALPEEAAAMLRALLRERDEARRAAIMEGNAREHFEAEADRLNAALATARADALKEAAAWHTAQADRLKKQYGVSVPEEWQHRDDAKNILALISKEPRA